MVVVSVSHWVEVVISRGVGDEGIVSEFFVADVFPGALGMFLGAAHAGCQIFEAVHVQSAAAVTRGLDTVAALELLHSGYHFGFVRTTVVEAFGWRGFSIWEERAGGVGDWDR